MVVPLDSAGAISAQYITGMTMSEPRPMPTMHRAAISISKVVDKAITALPKARISLILFRAYFETGDVHHARIACRESVGGYRAASSYIGSDGQISTVLRTYSESHFDFGT
jgi:hypothetical protein